MYVTINVPCKNCDASQIAIRDYLSDGTEVAPFFYCSRCGNKWRDDNLPVDSSDGAEWNPKDNQCSECRDSEHEDFDQDILLVVIKSDGKLAGRMKLCSEHRYMRGCDGYDLFHNGRRLE